ncbi:nicotinate-nucleotide adenylyltransferase [Marinomonas agarivorans]|nr:nicotinate-nucleotide adenylyltransferase [Marinomonas agarivorans]
MASSVNTPTEVNGQAELKSVAIMGGTFDPIHNGHLRVAVEILDHHNFSELRLIPCYQPVHKKHPIISSEDRLTMIKLACQSDSRLLVDSREIVRQEPSYTINTLRDLRQELGEKTPLVMIVGMDSFLSLPAWDSWHDIIHYAHILVVSRPNWEQDFVRELADFYENYRVESAEELKLSAAGKIYLEALTPLSISSSMIRTLCRQKASIAYLLPDNVQRFIEQNELYI